MLGGETPAISEAFLISLREMPFACANRLVYFTDVRSGNDRSVQLQAASDPSFEPNMLRRH
jgi:hypothetical protein